jgi:hypothetical protein
MRDFVSRDTVYQQYLPKDWTIDNEFCKPGAGDQKLCYKGVHVATVYSDGCDGYEATDHAAIEKIKEVLRQARYAHDLEQQERRKRADKEFEQSRNQAARRANDILSGGINVTVHRILRSV